MTSTAWLPQGTGFPKEIAIRQQAEQWEFKFQGFASAYF
jgi:hypothetical protein